MAATDYNQKTIDRFHAQKGRGVEPWGDNLLLMTSKGAKTGQDVTTPLVHRREGNQYYVVGSKGGAPDDPKWLRSVEINPMVEAEVVSGDGTEHFQARAQILREGPERDRLYAHMAEVWPAFADYETKTERKIPIVILERVD